MQVHVLEAGRDQLRLGAGLASLTTRTWMPFFAADGSADEGFLLEGGNVFGGDDPLPDPAIQQCKQFLGRGMLDLASLVDDDDLGGGGFHVQTMWVEER